jgi:hypothetical protein
VTFSSWSAPPVGPGLVPGICEVCSSPVAAPTGSRCQNGTIASPGLRSVLGPQQKGEPWTTTGTSGHQTFARTAGRSAYGPLTSYGGDERSGVRRSSPGCREPSGLLPTTRWVSEDGPHRLGEPEAVTARCEHVALGGRATNVPFTAVLTGPERTTTDNAKAAWTCTAHLLRRSCSRPNWLCKQGVVGSSPIISTPPDSRQRLDVIEACGSCTSRSATLPNGPTKPG